MNEFATKSQSKYVFIKFFIKSMFGRIYKENIKKNSQFRNVYFYSNKII